MPNQYITIHCPDCGVPYSTTMARVSELIRRWGGRCLECRHPPKDLSALNNTLQVTITHNGTVHTFRAPLGEAFDLAMGPMSLEAGCMSAVRRICADIWGP